MCGFCCGDYLSDLGIGPVHGIGWKVTEEPEGPKGPKDLLDVLGRNPVEIQCRPQFMTGATCGVHCSPVCQPSGDAGVAVVYGRVAVAVLSCPACGCEGGSEGRFVGSRSLEILKEFLGFEVVQIPCSVGG